MQEWEDIEKVCEKKGLSIYNALIREGYLSADWTRNRPRRSNRFHKIYYHTSYYGHPRSASSRPCSICGITCPIMEPYRSINSPHGGETH
jgi:hypothetical protein